LDKSVLLKFAVKILIKISLALVFLPYILAACVNAQDLSTDDAVIAELQKKVDAKRAELGTTGDSKLDAKRNAGSQLDARSVCVRRLKESAKVIVIGFFRTDYGCHYEGAFVNSHYFEKTDVIELSKAALEEFGWRTANQMKREKLALAWVEKGLLAFFTVLYTTSEDFGRSEFHPPRTASAENGRIKVTLWYQVPSGSSREKGYQQVEYTFSGDGKYSGSSTLTALILSNARGLRLSCRSRISKA
jgi:hypothetical protein